MERYQTILVGLDFTAEGSRVLQRAALMSRTFGAATHVVHVIEHFPEDLPVETIAREDRDPQAALVRRARERAENLARKAGLDDARIIVALTRRSARRELLEQAASLEADLIIVAGAGEAGLAGLGSTASAIVHRAPCDVLVVHGE